MRGTAHAFTIAAAVSPATSELRFLSRFPLVLVFCLDLTSHACIAKNFCCVLECKPGYVLSSMWCWMWLYVWFMVMPTDMMTHHTTDVGLAHILLGANCQIHLYFWTQNNDGLVLTPVLFGEG